MSDQIESNSVSNQNSQHGSDSISRDVLNNNNGSDSSSQASSRSDQIQISSGVPFDELKEKITNNEEFEPSYSYSNVDHESTLPSLRKRAFVRRSFHNKVMAETDAHYDAELSKSTDDDDDVYDDAGSSCGDLLTDDQNPSLSPESKVEVLNDTKNYFFQLTTKDIESVVTSWKLLYKLRASVSENFAAFVKNDEDFKPESRQFFLEKMSVPILIEGYNSIIQHLEEYSKWLDSHNVETNNLSKSQQGSPLARMHITSRIDDMLRENQDDQQNSISAIEQEKAALKAISDIETMDTTAQKLEYFDKIFEFLQKIGKVHRINRVSRQEILVARKNLYATIQQSMGAAFTTEMSEAWIKLTNFVTVGILSNVKTHRRPHVPDYEAFETCRLSWKLVSENMDASLAILWKLLTDHSYDMIDFFPSAGHLKAFEFVSILLNISQDQDVLKHTLKDLGRKHASFAVQKRHFRQLQKCWYQMLGQVLGVQYSRTVELAWKQVIPYFFHTIQTSLEQANMLSLPKNADAIKLSLKIVSLSGINPRDLTVDAEVILHCSNIQPSPSSLATLSNKLPQINLHRVPSMVSVSEIAHNDKESTAALSAIPSVILDQNPINYNTFYIDNTNVQQSAQSQKDIPKWKPRIENVTSVEDKVTKHGLLPYKKEVDTGWSHQQHLIGKFQQTLDMSKYPFELSLLICVCFV